MNQFRRVPLILFLTLATLLGVVGAQDSAVPVLTVDAAESLGTISPYVLGSNYGPLQAVTVDTMDAAIDSGVTILRFPAGRWGDTNDIRPLQVDMLMAVAGQIGADVMINARLENGTPEAAAELVRYVNIEKGYGVRYWGIGNEPNLFDDYDTERYNREWRAIAEAMLAVDPEILLIGPETSQYVGDPAQDPRDSAGRDWVREFLLANGDLVDIVAVHRYPFPRSRANPNATIPELRENAPEWSQILPALRAVIRETTGREDVPVAVTETNSHWSASPGGEATPDSHYNAIWWADVLGRLIRDDAYMVNYFDFASADTRGGFGLLNRYDVRPTYYTYQIYRQFGTERLAAASPDDTVTIYAARGDNGTLTLVVINMSDETQTRAIAINGFTPAGPAEAIRLDLDHNAEPVDAAELPGEVTLPPQSVTLYLVPPA